MLAPHVLSGIDVLDQAWDGLRRGSAYLLYGPARSGRDLVALHLARTGAACDETTVLVSARDPGDLVERAASLGFDLDAAARSGAVRLLRLPSLADADDEALEQALRAVARVVRERAPDRLLVDDFTPLVRFREFPRLRQAVLDFLAALAETPAVTVLGLGEPANAQSREIVAFLRGQTAGAVRLTADDEGGTPSARRLHLQPPPDSPEPERSHAWDLRRLQRSGLAAAHALFAEPAHEQPHAGDSSALAAEPILALAGPSEPPPPEPPDDDPAPEDSEPREPSSPAPEAPIRFFDPLDPLGPPPEVEDPFGALPALEDLFARAHFVEGTGAAVVEPAPAAPSEPGPLSRAAFAEAFAAARRAGTPFLLLSLRAEPGSEVPFDALALGLSRAAAPGDALLSEPARQRLALLLPGRSADAAQGVFRHVKVALREAGAEGSLRSVAALVLPEGKPFTSAEDFLARVIDGA